MRSLNRRSEKKPPGAAKNEPHAEPAVCEPCGAVFSRRTRRDHRATHALLARAAWATCPGGPGRALRPGALLRGV